MILGTPAAPTLETPRLILRGWRPGDVTPYAAMLADDATARFITAKGRGLTKAEAWNETVWLVGHWQILSRWAMTSMPASPLLLVTRA